MRTSALLLKMFTIMSLIIGIPAYIASLYGYHLRYKGAELPEMDLPTLIALLVIAVFFWIAGHFLDKAADKKARSMAIEQIVADVSFLYARIKRSAIRNIIVAIFLLALGVLCGIGMMQASGSDSIAVGIFGLLFFLIGILILWMNLKSVRPESNLIYKAVVMNPSTIDTLNVQVVSPEFPDSSGNITITQQGRSLGIISLRKNEIKKLILQIKRYNPNVRVTTNDTSVV